MVRRPSLVTRAASLLVTLAGVGGSGCAALTNPVADGVPVNRLPAEVLARPKAEMRPIPLTLLRQREPDVYRLAKGDVLAVVAPNVIAPPDQQPPVKLPDQFSDTAAIGFPVPVGEDGTISLPRVPPLSVTGLTLREAEALIEKAVTGQLPGYPELVKPDAVRVTVQLMQKRRYTVLVNREDTLPSFGFQVNPGQPILGGTRKGAGFTLQLPAGENDVLHALNASGGPPGLDARNEVIILRGQYDPADPLSRATRIPLRVFPDQPLVLREQDIILGDGDIVLIEARETEVYYTAGLIGGGQFPLPRDYDLDVIQAIAQVRGPLVNGSFSQNAFVAQAVQAGIGFPNPSLVTILRRLPNGQQLPIRVDVNKALQDPRERILIMPGDILVMQEKPGEAILRYLTSTFRFTTVFPIIAFGDSTGILTGTHP